MALMDISVIPLDGGSGGLSAKVAELEALLAESGLDYKLNDMGTTVSGTATELFAIAEKLHGYLFTTGSQRVYTVLKIDDRRDKDVSIGDKVASVERQMGGSGSGPRP
ncbi:MAG: MTH1187 family thiamine-binding protein [Chlorobiales bacterium]|nr:MTH1187 family thiamine-binding protein [Chlorobiales bacterium]